MEVSIAATISRDPALIAYVSDPSKDMHLDCASSMFFLDAKEVPKPLRNNATKGPFVFAAFYGSYYKLMASGIWAEIDIPDAEKVYGFDVVKHLRKNGIKAHEQWENHVQEQERILWEERFPVYQSFRNTTYDIFKKQGFINYPNGFRYYGPASRNEVLNSTVQGPAFHIQAWAFTQITKIMEAKKMNSAFIGQVHDSMVASVDPMEESYLDNLVYEYATQRVKEHWDWITVPLMVEKERSEVDGDWASMSACGYLTGGN
jgi:DNA polymerase I-like protein with 3'-5' exonuclease and polymerase domains